MKTFLHEVAEDLYARYGEGLSERAILFPSRRARLFFVDALTGIAGRPMWQPRWVTVDDLTTEISGLRTGDRVRVDLPKRRVDLLVSDDEIAARRAAYSTAAVARQ